jgi:hypothetical protein
MIKTLCVLTHGCVQGGGDVRAVVGVARRRQKVTWVTGRQVNIHRVTQVN